MFESFNKSAYCFDCYHCWPNHQIRLGETGAFIFSKNHKQEVIDKAFASFPKKLLDEKYLDLKERTYIPDVKICPKLAD